MPACSKNKGPYIAPGGCTGMRSASYSGRFTPRVSLQYSLYGRSVGPLSPSIRGSICVTLTISLWTGIFNGLQSTVENASTYIARTWRDALTRGHLYLYQNISNKLRWHNYINKCVRGRSFKLHCTVKKRPSAIVFTCTSHTKRLKQEHNDFISKCISTCTSAIRSESKTAHRNARACGRTTLWHFLSLLVGKLRSSYCLLLQTQRACFAFLSFQRQFLLEGYVNFKHTHTGTPIYEHRWEQLFIPRKFPSNSFH